MTATPNKSIAKMDVMRRQRAQRIRYAKLFPRHLPRRYAKAAGWPASLLLAIFLQLMLGAVALFSLMSMNSADSQGLLAFALINIVLVVGLVFRSRVIYGWASTVAVVELLAVYGNAMYAYARGTSDGLAAWSLAHFDLLPDLPGNWDVVLSTMCPALILIMLKQQRVRDCFGLPVWV